MSRKRMVIFGCGYVGRTLARAAITEGYDVWIHSRDPETLLSVKEVPTSNHIVSDLHVDGWHRSLPGEWDVAINLVSSAGGGLYGYELSYIEGNRSILRWAENATIKKFIYTSATTVYPQTDGEWVCETNVPELDDLSSTGRILRRAENEILKNKVIENKIVVRLGGIYGPGRHLYLDSLRNGIRELPGDGTAYLNLIHLNDICDVLLQLSGKIGLENAIILNLVDNEPTSKQDIVDWLARQVKAPELIFNPALAGPRGSRRSVSGKLPNRRIQNDKIRDVLGWSPKYPSFREGYEAILKG